MPKAKTLAVAPTTTVYIVSHCAGIDSVYATPEAAIQRIESAKAEGKDALLVETQTLNGGTIILSPPEPESKTATKKAIKSETVDDEAPTKKTKTAAEQRAENEKKGKKSTDEDLPEIAKTLLAAKGNALDGMSIVVTGIPPTLGRKNAEKLVEKYGGKLLKSLSKKTTYVVIGNDAGPKKLEQIEELGIKTLDEDGLMELCGGDVGNPSKKRKL